MSHAFFDLIYESWKPKQLQKFEQVFPFIKDKVRSQHSMLDLGIGRAWFECFLMDRGIKFSRVLGVDVNELLVKPKLSWIDYEFSKNFQTAERFDWVVCIDALHLLEDKNLVKFAKPEGFVLVALPSTFLNQFPKFENCVVLHEGFVGKDEKDYFQLLQVK